MVFLDSSVLVMVPSGALVTVYSFDVTVPSRLTLLLLVSEILRSRHPTSINVNAKADAATQITNICFFILLLHSLLFHSSCYFPPISPSCYTSLFECGLLLPITPFYLSRRP